MKIGMIGIGDIARKAYLPILGTRDDIELSIASRNHEVVQQVGQQYRIQHRFATVEELIDSRIEAAFVHAATEAHPAIVRQLIQAGIHVFVDKPIAYSLEESEELVKLADQQGVQMMVGFNRRFAPMYRDLQQEIALPDTVLMQKNRVQPLSDPRKTVFDDFIHVVDTLVFFLGGVQEVTFRTKVENGLLHYIVVNLVNGTTTGIGIMNRHTGVTEEILEVMGEQKKREVHNLSKTISYSHNQEQHLSFDDWAPILYRRGFVSMIDHFIDCIRSGAEPETSGAKSIRTHQICEMITSQLEDELK